MTQSTPSTCVMQGYARFSNIDSKLIILLWPRVVPTEDDANSCCPFLQWGLGVCSLIVCPYSRVLC